MQIISIAKHYAKVLDRKVSEDMTILKEKFLIKYPSKAAKD